MPDLMLTIYRPVERTIPDKPCLECGFTRYEVTLCQQLCPVPLPLYANLVTALGQKHGYLLALADGWFETHACLRCNQPDDEEPYEDDDAIAD